MTKKNLSDYKRLYNISRHHAWAGSVLLAILLATRIFLETSNFGIDEYDLFIIGIGVILIIYTLVAIFFTYKYRSGLIAEEKQIEVHFSSPDLKIVNTKAEIEKERLKLEKKKTKSEAKKSKKSLKKLNEKNL
jgi:hypothetical protein